MRRKKPTPHIQEYKGFTIVRGYRSAVNPHPLYYVNYQRGYDDLSLGGFSTPETARNYIDTLI